jgi:RimJ/RimL family protein N-acetyltransferase
MANIAIRPVKSIDVHNFLVYANALSAENTFVQLSGKTITLKEERIFLRNRLALIKNGQSVCLVCEVDGAFAGTGHIDRLPGRSHHVGELHISIAKEYRGKGLGYKLLRALLDEAKTTLHLRMVILHCFEINYVAISLYTKVGFRKAGCIPGMLAYNNDYTSEVAMYLPLE